MTMIYREFREKLLSKKKTVQLRFSYQKEDLCSASVSRLIAGAVDMI